MTAWIFADAGSTTLAVHGDPVMPAGKYEVPQDLHGNS